LHNNLAVSVLNFIDGVETRVPYFIQSNHLLQRMRNKKKKEERERENRDEKDKKKKKRSNGVVPKSEGGTKLRLPKSMVPQVQVQREYVFLDEIGKMMFSFGDVRNPLEESVKIIESYVKKQILSMLEKAEQVAILKETKIIDVQDVVFLFRKDTPKLTRIERFLKSKDKTQQRMAGQKRKRPSVTDSLFEEISDEEDKFSLDDYDMKRLIANDLVTKDMSLDDHIDWQRCKEATLVNVKKLRDWIGFDVKIMDRVIELFGYLAWEVVGLLCQAALIVKREMELRLNDTQFITIGIATGVMTEQLREKLSFVSEINITKPNIGTHKKPLQPTHLFEAVRRLASINQLY
jgi:hypothetical protein